MREWYDAQINSITFYKIKIERCIVDMREVQRAHGMEMMMGGHALLANIMGPDADLAKILPDSTAGLICDECACRAGMPLASIVERFNDAKANDDPEAESFDAEATL